MKYHNGYIVSAIVSGVGMILSSCSLFLKDEGVTDEDYIRINVRWGYLSMPRNWERSTPVRVDPKNLKETLEYSAG